jgi:hypothetical protein
MTLKVFFAITIYFRQFLPFDWLARKTFRAFSLLRYIAFVIT